MKVIVNREVVDKELPVVGSYWRHYNGEVYRIIHIANVMHLNPKHNTYIIYESFNRNVWAKTIPDFFGTMANKDMDKL